MEVREQAREQQDPEHVAPETMDLLLQMSLRSQEQVIEAISALHEKTGNVVNVAAVVAGLYLFAGFVGLRDLNASTCVGSSTAAFQGFYLGVAASIGSIAVSLLAWTFGAQTRILNPRELVDEYENETGEALQAFLVGQLMHQFKRNERTHKRLRLVLAIGLLLLLISVLSVPAFIWLANQALMPPCLTP